MNAAEWKKTAVERLKRSGDIDAEADTNLFLCAILELDPWELRLRLETELSETQLSKLYEMLRRRESGEPEQYIEGVSYFMGHRFIIDKRALIPRQDTETLCERAINEIKCLKYKDVLDLCCGSGCIGISAKLACPWIKVDACDISADAVELTKLNASHNGVDISAFTSDGFNSLNGREYDLILCNPPYLTKDDMQCLQTEVRHEPALALFGGDDGLDFYRRFALEMKPHLRRGGTAIFEFGQGQAKDICAIFKANYPESHIEIINDINGIERDILMRI
ncbi:MAG: peptide chain release factor N(5)-glutamine methyltransferase [Clostridia bacterium]|nr:peptide chain release factor N(5)-glutamine methyltransferase [Clostridia bacterium]